MRKAENIAETIGYYLSSKGEATTKGAQLIEDYAKQQRLVTKDQLFHILDIMEDIIDSLNEDDLELYEQLLTKYREL